MKRLETEADSQTGQSAVEGETSEEEIENNHNSRVTFLLTWNRSVIQSLWMVILRTIVLKPLPKKTHFGNLEERKIHTRMRDEVSNENDNHWILQQCSLSQYFLRILVIIGKLFSEFLEGNVSDFKSYLWKSLLAVVLILYTRMNPTCFSFLIGNIASSSFAFMRWGKFYKDLHFFTKQHFSTPKNQI